MPDSQDFEAFIKACNKHFTSKYDKEVVRQAALCPVKKRVYDAWWEHVYRYGPEPSALIERLRAQL